MFIVITLTLNSNNVCDLTCRQSDSHRCLKLHQPLHCVRTWRLKMAARQTDWPSLLRCTVFNLNILKEGSRQTSCKLSHQFVQSTRSQPAQKRRRSNVKPNKDAKGRGIVSARAVASQSQQNFHYFLLCHLLWWIGFQQSLIEKANSESTGRHSKV